MKSKEAFLEALQQGIAVLAESEQQDILEEYAQHIEMKRSGGLTEEEAIQDFGDIHQLIAEILEAYHVDPSYVYGRGDHPSPDTSLGRPLTGLGKWLQSGGRKIADFTKKCLLAPFTGEEKSPSAESQTGVCAREKAASCPGQKFGRRFIKGLKATAWLVWNGALLFCALPVLCMGIAALVLMGVTMVWMSQGMPLVGAFLCSVGGLATCVGVLGLGRNLIWHRRRTAGCRETQTEEVHEDANE